MVMVINYSSSSRSADILPVIAAAAAEAASNKIGSVPFNPGIFAMSAGLRIVPFSVIEGRWLKVMKLVSLCVILTIVPVSGSVLKISEAFCMLPRSTGAMPVSTCPVTFVCTGSGISPKSK